MSIMLKNAINVKYNMTTAMFLLFSTLRYVVFLLS